MLVYESVGLWFPMFRLIFCCCDSNHSNWILKNSPTPSCQGRSQWKLGDPERFHPFFFFGAFPYFSRPSFGWITFTYGPERIRIPIPIPSPPSCGHCGCNTQQGCSTQHGDIGCQCHPAQTPGVCPNQNRLVCPQERESTLANSSREPSNFIY